MTERTAEAATLDTALSNNDENLETKNPESVSPNGIPSAKAEDADSQSSASLERAAPTESESEAHRGSLTPTGPQQAVSGFGNIASQTQADPVADKGPDYFTFQSQPRDPQQSTEHSLTVTVPTTNDYSVASSHNPTPQEQTSLIDLPNSPAIFNRISPQVSRPPTSDPATTRPVSIAELPPRPIGGPQPIPEDGCASSEAMVPSVTSHNYPPPSSRITRTHSSHSPHYSHSSIRESPVKDVIQGHNGARTAGNTPAQSPGFDSTSVRSPLSGVRKHTQEAEDGRPSSQILQPSNLQAPIETHKLNKDIDPVSGRKQLNNYELIEKLGSGQHGTVKRGRNLKTGDLCAVKIVRRFTKKVRLGRTGDPDEFIKKEVAILKKARHPHVVSLYEVIDDPEFDKVYLVLEYVERGEIVWRKRADAAIGLFEKGRVAREHTEGYDVHSEHGAIEEFNRGVAARRKEKEELLAQQKRKARERLQHPETRRSIFWNPDVGASFERDDIPPRYHGESQDNMRLSRADQHAVDHPGDAPQSATPIYTTKALSHALNTQFSNSQPSSQPTSAPSSVPPSQPPSQPVSRPTSPHLPEGSMYSPYVEEKSPSDLEFQHVLQQVIEEDSEPWPPDAEAFQHVPCLTLSQASDAFRDTVLGIEYLHYQGIIHRDIKPANLLWTRYYRVKISDFGVSYLGKPVREDSEHEDLPAPENSQHDEDIELAKTVGTPAFYAPELCDPDNFDPDKRSERPAITGQIDVWALGVTLYCMIFGRLPFFDCNEFRMYEKIARDEVFVPRVRLMGVSHTDKTPSDHYKRLDDVLEYEEIDDTLSDLLRRLLVKDPAKRITLMEVKRHPWVISGIEDKEKWLEETDPSRQSEGRKIEVSTQEVQEAVVGLTFIDSLVKGVQRIGSVFRGRSSRKRGLSNPKSYEPPSSVSSPRFPDDRRSSLRGDEQIVAALKHSHGSREPEHPLSHSVAASPGYKSGREYFSVDKSEERPKSALEVLERHRPSVSTSRTISTADSMKTVTAREAGPRQAGTDQRTVSAEDFASTTHAIDYNSSSSSIGGILGGAGRRIAYSFRSRERGGSQHSPSQTSRSSSVDTNLNPSVTEDYRASPSLGISSAIAAGHVDPPPALRENEEYSFPAQSSTESLYANRPRESALRRPHGEVARLPGGHRRSVSYAPEVQTQPSDDDIVNNQQRPASAAESSFAISSSSDQIVSEDSAAHSRIPSVVSRASSVSAPIEEESKPFNILNPPKPFSSSTERPYSAASLDETISADPATAKARAAQQEEEAELGYNGGEEGQDSDSEDEGLSMA